MSCAGFVTLQLRRSCLRCCRPAARRSTLPLLLTAATPDHKYLIGPLDTLNIIVWRNPELSLTVPVRPDGRISTPLVEDLVAQGRNPTDLARDIEKALSKYTRDPVVTVIVTSFVGPPASRSA